MISYGSYIYNNRGFNRISACYFTDYQKVHPAYSLILGALVGGLIGGGDLVTIVNTMVLGAQGMMSSILRILTSGILAGALIKTGSAEKLQKVSLKN